MCWFVCIFPSNSNQKVHSYTRIHSLGHTLLLSLSLSPSLSLSLTPFTLMNALVTLMQNPNPSANQDRHVPSSVLILISATSRVQRISSVFFQCAMKPR